MRHLSRVVSWKERQLLVTCYLDGLSSFIALDKLAGIASTTTMLASVLNGILALKQLTKSAGTTTFLDSAWAFFRSGLTTLDDVKRIAEGTK